MEIFISKKSRLTNHIKIRKKIGHFIMYITLFIDYNDDSSLKIRIVFRDISVSNRLEFSRKLWESDI